MEAIAAVSASEQHGDLVLAPPSCISGGSPEPVIGNTQSLRRELVPFFQA